MLKKRAKKDFEYWVWKQNQELIKKDVKYYLVLVEGKFEERIPFDMRFGFYVKWFCRVGIPIGVAPEYNEHNNEFNGYMPIIRDAIFWKANEDGYYKDLQEAREVLIREAMIIYNKELSWKEFKEQRGYGSNK